MSNIINLMGDRMLLDYLITSYFPFTYENNIVKVDYNSYLELNDVEQKIEQLKNELSTYEVEDDYKNSIRDGVAFLEDLKKRIEEWQQ